MSAVSSSVELTDLSPPSNYDIDVAEGQCITNGGSLPAAAPDHHQHQISYDDHRKQQPAAAAAADDVLSVFSFEHNIDKNIMDRVRGSGVTAMTNNTSTGTATNHGGRVSEITEIMEEDQEVTSSTLFISMSGGGNMESTSLFSIDINQNRDADVVYVGVGKSESSMGALLWTLNHAVIPGATIVYLVHIFSEIKRIPSPLGGGWVPKNQVSQDLVDSYTSEETSKRRALLTKYVDKCTAHLVQVETILIESDSIANAMVELISVLNITKLVLGISKSNLRKLRGGKWNGSTVADQVMQSAPAECQLNIICQGKDISEFGDDHSPASPLIPTTKPKSPTSVSNPTGENQQEPTANNSFTCCFRGHQS